MVDHLLAFVENLCLVETLLGFAGEVGAAAHRDGSRERLSKAGDDDQRLGRVGCSHAGDDTKRHEQAILCPKHDLADARELPDALGLPECVVPDVLLGLESGGFGDRRIRHAMHRNATGVGCQVG